MKKNGKIVIGFMIGIVVSLTGVYAAEVISSSEVSFDNTNSKLESDNVQDALDEIYTKVKNFGISLADNKNVKAVYEYSQEEKTKCIIGEEDTCRVSTCMYNSMKGSCKAGTIIKYAVNNNEIKYFYILHDDGDTVTLQQRENTIDNIKWYADVEDNTKGPLTVLAKLEGITNSWSNVNTISYTMGATDYKETDIDCQLQNGIYRCNENFYTLEKKNVKARMITLLEVDSIGCTGQYQSCPNWMYNYLEESSDYGGTMNGISKGYWTMTASSYNNTNAYHVSRVGNRDRNHVTTYSYYGARAVIVINK